YAGTEGMVVFSVSGEEWEERPGTVGLPRGGEVQIRAADETVLSAGQTGRIWLRREAALGESFRYLGATATASEGWQTLGDIGHLDADGYLFIEDREADMLLVGGSNVYPAEIEAALLSHPAVVDVCVIGLPDDDLGQAPHAIIFSPTGADSNELLEHARATLAGYKLPRSFEFVDEPVRDAAGKVRRQNLRDARINPASGAGAQ
ncbi:AMP-binding enzyme, partial [Microbacterium sp. A93]|uniref:AMP-binding enzyme n=1 Tax=Microbacterium sp. A93 TaxID=3450716 RepID=UPI003F430078